MRLSPILGFAARALAGLALGAPLALAHQGTTLPAGFQEVPVTSGLEQPTDFAFLPDGRILVTEKAGRVLLIDGGKVEPLPVVDLTEEVADISSHGLKSLALDPAVAQNGYLYLLYEVDRHHLFFHGTPAYDPQASDLVGPTVGRITRYTLDPGTGWRSTVPGSRKVLLGETRTTGFPIVDIHETGALRFGEDGSLLATCGDGSTGASDQGGSAESLQAIAEGFLDPKYDFGAFRTQLVDVLNGKVVRLDPATGDGLPGNPFFDAKHPRSARSRVWALGLRNPFRLAVLPGTSTGPGDPGAIVIGDVGTGLFEELNVSRVGGENFGWPLYEGMEPRPEYIGVDVFNTLAPNPLYGVFLPGIGSCDREFFSFGDLVPQERLGPLFVTNPCDPSLPAPPATFARFHTRPSIDWGHLGPARTKTFDFAGGASIANIGDPGSPVTGPQFDGSCVVVGAWYATGNYPAAYDASLFVADHTKDWIRVVKFDAAGSPTEVIDFGEELDAIVALATDPVTGDLHTLHIGGDLHRIDYAGGNLAPSARATALPRYGPAPHRVVFDAGLSDDPEGLPLALTWDFGDGTPPSSLASPVRVFPSRDATDDGTIAAAVLEAFPPQQPLAVGLFPSVMADGVFVNPATAKKVQEYLTFPTGAPDPDPTDWIGFTFPSQRSFHGLVFQEGREYGAQGGWFEDLAVEVRVNGVWTTATGLEVRPPYGGQDGDPYEIHELLFDELTGDAIRLIGTAGGTDTFISVVELRAIERPASVGPQRFDVTLTVRDSANNVATDAVPVWSDNTPPNVAILSPVNGGTVDLLNAPIVTLSAFSSDAESGGGALDCSWEIALHHNDHAHPEPDFAGCSGTVQLAPHPPGPGNFYWEFTLTVTDPLGLSTTRSSLLYEEPPALSADLHWLSLERGGTSRLMVDAGPARAGQLYWLLMSGSGTWPGIDFGNGSVLPLNFDDLVLLTILKPSLPEFEAFRGLLDANGTATAKFHLPPGSDPLLSGVSIHFATIVTSTLGVAEFASNAVPITFED